MIPHISSIPTLTEADKQTLEGLRGSEIFLIMLKLLAKEWHLATAQMTTCNRDELVAFQGHARALISVYNQLMLYANVDVPDKETPVALLNNVRKLNNLK